MFNLWIFVIVSIITRQALTQEGSVPHTPLTRARAAWEARVPKMEWADHLERDAVRDEMPGYLVLARFMLLPTALDDWRRELPGVPKRLAEPEIISIAARAGMLALSCWSIALLFAAFHATAFAHTISQLTHTRSTDTGTTLAIFAFGFFSFVGRLRWAAAWLFPLISLGFGVVRAAQAQVTQRAATIPIIAHSRLFLATYAGAAALAFAWPHHPSYTATQIATAETLVAGLLGYALSYLIPAQFFPSRTVAFAFRTKLAAKPERDRSTVPEPPIHDETRGDFGMPSKSEYERHASDTSHFVYDDEEVDESPTARALALQRFNDDELRDKARSLGPLFDFRINDYRERKIIDERIEGLDFVNDDQDPDLLRREERGEHGRRVHVPRYRFESAFPAVQPAAAEIPKIAQNEDGSFSIDPTAPLKAPPID